MSLCYVLYLQFSSLINTADHLPAELNIVAHMRGCLFYGGIRGHHKTYAGGWGRKIRNSTWADRSVCLIKQSLVAVPITWSRGHFLYA